MPTELHGEHVILRPVDPEQDAVPLYAASHAPSGDATIWTYLYDGPYPDLESFRASLEEQAARRDYLFLTVTRAGDGQPLGIVSYLSIVPEHGVIEIGNIWFGPELQRTPAATEAIFLLAKHAFDDLGYRRLEWKCNALNEPSRRAAIRFGFEFEGVFMQPSRGQGTQPRHCLVRDHRRPLAGGQRRVRAWLSPENFDAGRHAAQPPERPHRKPAAQGSKAFKSLPNNSNTWTRTESAEQP